MKAFVVCPVRNVTQDEQNQIQQAVERLEGNGFVVHWPLRDTRQDDPVGNKICDQNLRAIEAADLIAIWYNPNSTGSLFDMGMAWALHKPIYLLQPVEATAGKSFANVLLSWAQNERRFV